MLRWWCICWEVNGGFDSSLILELSRHGGIGWDRIDLCIGELYGVRRGGGFNSSRQAV